MTKFLKRFGRKKGKSKKEKRGGKATAPLKDAPLDWDVITSQASGKVSNLIASSALDIGRRRENNEDALLCLSGVLGSQNDGNPLGIYVIADGMGGHRNGEIASEIAVRALGAHLVGKLYKPMFGPEPNPTEESLREIMETAVHVAHTAVKRAAPGGGCTLTAALMVGAQVVIAHLGDSRAYAIARNGKIESLTKDHSLVKRLQEMGQLTAEEAATHPQKSVLYRALGQGEAAQADIFSATLPNPGYLMICSDGLWGVVDEDEMERIVNSAASPYLACQQLVEAANAAGGPDNISVILARLVN